MRLAFGFDNGLAAGAVQHERHREDCRQRIALLPSRWTDIESAGGCAPCQINNAGDGLGLDAGPVVGDDDLAALGRDDDLDHRRDAELLGNVDAVVDQLFDDDKRPVFDGVPGQRNQLPFGAEFGEAACAERLAG
jgi:hypothetical protein